MTGRRTTNSMTTLTTESLSQRETSKGSTARETHTSEVSFTPGCSSLTLRERVLSFWLKTKLIKSSDSPSTKKTL